MNLRDAGVPNDDTSYDAADTENPVSMDYYRDKARQFQLLLNQLDAALRSAYLAESAHISPAFDADMRGYIDQIEGKRAYLKATAEAINAGASIINAAGGRFPVLSVPTGLGLLPAIPVATIAAIGGVVALIAWGSQLVAGLNERLKYAATVQNLTPEQRAKVATAANTAQRAGSMLDFFSGMGTAGKVVMFVGVGILAWMAFQAFQRRR